MKSKLPIILLVGGIVLVAAIFLMRGRGAPEEAEEENVPELPFSQRPYTYLVPLEDEDGGVGREFNMVVENINVPGADSMDYEFYYQTSAGLPQGVPGTVRLNGQTNIERTLLLGSESSGVKRYDEGVTEGTLTLRFRDSDGKMIGKVAGQWHLISGTNELVSLDGNFKYTLDEESDAVFIVMPTFGVPSSTPAEVVGGPYGVFASTEDQFPGQVDMAGNVLAWTGSNWESINGASEQIGVFISTN